MVKNLSAMQETWVQSLDQEDALEKGTAIHSSILTWKTPWREEFSGQQSIGCPWGHKETDMTKQLTHSH